MYWMKPDPKGKSPLPRYDHSMVYNELLGLIIIYGGKNDKFTFTY
jgi:hypothetical protein